MSRRIEVFSSLILLLIVVVVAVGLVQWWHVGREIESVHAEDARMVIGTDEKLTETVQNLERTLKERLEYQFDVSVDPLDLTRVITSRKLLEKLGADEFERSKQNMRLAATIVGPENTAAIVIRYMGSNHILRVGDQISGWTVAEIRNRETVLTRNGVKRVLKNQKAPESIGGGGMQLSVDTAPEIASSANSGNN